MKHSGTMEIINIVIDFRMVNMMQCILKVRIS